MDTLCLTPLCSQVFWQKHYVILAILMNVWYLFYAPLYLTEDILITLSSILKQFLWSLEFWRRLLCFSEFSHRHSMCDHSIFQQRTISCSFEQSSGFLRIFSVGVCRFSSKSFTSTLIVGIFINKFKFLTHFYKSQLNDFQNYLQLSCDLPKSDDKNNYWNPDDWISS